MTIDFKTEILTSEWGYQQTHFRDWQRCLERPLAPDGRPPVFLPGQAWRNVIANPRAEPREIERLIAFIPQGDRHKWFRSMNSSQALAQSVFGNLAISNHLDLLGAIRDENGLAVFENANLSPEHLAMEFKIGYLGEPRSTRLDVFFEGDYRVAVECKFTEEEVGTCSRPRLTPGDTNYQTERCNGTYTRQDGRDERCSLSAIGVLYWKYVPVLFRWQADQDIIPCPLDLNYQLVRNVLAVGVKPDAGASSQHGHAVVLFDERNPAFRAGGKGLKAFQETKSALLDERMLRICSWQQIVAVLREKKILPWLVDRLFQKYGIGKTPAEENANRST